MSGYLRDPRRRPEQRPTPAAKTSHPRKRHSSKYSRTTSFHPPNSLPPRVTRRQRTELCYYPGLLLSSPASLFSNAPTANTAIRPTEVRTSTAGRVALLVQCFTLASFRSRSAP